jgi:hypothetical protein
MKLQLYILLANIRLSFTKLLAVVGAFFLPISGILFLVGFAIFLDTLTGLWKAKKLKIPITSRKLSAVVSKLFLYEIAVIGFYLIDYFILNDIIMKFFSVPLMLTKILALILVSIECISINENYFAIRKISIWDSMKSLFARAKEIKNDINGIRSNQDSSTPSI